MTVRLVILTVICGLLRACGQGSYKSVNDISLNDFEQCYIPTYLTLFLTGFGYLLAGWCLQKYNHEKTLPVKRDFVISGLNVFLGTILQGLVANSFSKGANLGGSEFVGQWIAIVIVVLFSSIVQKRHHSVEHLVLIMLIIVGSSIYIIYEPTVAEKKIMPSWMIISLVGAVLSGFCMATYSWWLDKNPLGPGSAMMITGSWCMAFSLLAILIGYYIGFFSKWNFPTDLIFWAYSLATVFFWVSGGILATIICIDGLLNGIRQSVTMGSLMIGVILIGALLMNEYPAIEQLPGIFLIIGSILMISRCRQPKTKGS